MYHYEKAIKLDPTNAVYRTNRAAVLLCENKVEASVAELLRAAAMAKPNYWRPRERLAQIATRRDGLSALLEGAQAACKRDPDSSALESCYQQLCVVAAARNEGNGLFLRGQYAEAERVYSDALEKARPSSPPPRTNLPHHSPIATSLNSHRSETLLSDLALLGRVGRADTKARVLTLVCVHSC